MNLIGRIVRKLLHYAARTGSFLRAATLAGLRLSWQLVWPVLAAIYAWLPEDGRLSRAFRAVVFTLPWTRYYRSAYIPTVRNTFFEYILTFFYNYPIRRGDVVVQIGASCGEETVRFARAVGKTGRVIAVEPESGNLERLRAALPPDQYPQVTIVPLGAWKCKGELLFFVGGEREHRIGEIPGGELTYEWWGEKDHLAPSRYKSSTKISVDAIDNIVRPFALKKIDFVLVETNGSELEVVEGMTEVLPIIRRCAVRGHVERDRAPIYKEIAVLLQEKGFQTTINTEGIVLGRQMAIAAQTMESTSPQKGADGVAATKAAA
jgi:FkbM family methyltransferase